jgi:hypothetical protein
VSPWNSQKYLNVWVCKLANDVNGYAQMPGGNPAIDGIVIDYRYFGVANYNDSPYDQGKTLTHLVGNYLNLFPLWGSGVRCSDDYVDDTPIHNAPNYGNPGPGHISICPGYPLEMTLNFMDNTVDAARCMFTYGQMLRMHSVLAAGAARSGLRQGYTQCNSDFEASENVLISVYPNPSSEKITVKIFSPDEALATIAIYSSDGRIIAARELPVGSVEAETEWDVHDWPEGTYAIHIRMGSELFSELLHIVKN